MFYHFFSLVFCKKKDNGHFSKNYWNKFYASISVTFLNQIFICGDPCCKIIGFLKSLEDTLFNEDICYNEERAFFTKICAENIDIFEAMCKLVRKGNHNIDKITELIIGFKKRKENSKNDLVVELLNRKVETLKQIDNLVE